MTSKKTTVMLSRLPRRLTVTDLREHLHMVVAPDSYDFIHMPRSSDMLKNLGLAFVNFMTAESATMCLIAFGHLPLGSGAQGARTCRTCWANVQGLAENLESYVASHGWDALHSPTAPHVFVGGKPFNLQVMFQHTQGLLGDVMQRLPDTAVVDKPSPQPSFSTPQGPGTWLQDPEISYAEKPVETGNLWGGLVCDLEHEFQLMGKEGCFNNFKSLKVPSQEAILFWSGNLLEF
jgi:hypothetical protein